MKVLITGCGYIGKVHLNSIRKYHLCEVAICEVDEERRKKTAMEFGVSETYASLAEALTHPFDGAVICTPNSMHQADMAACMEAGLNVMLEKPISHNLKAAQEMCKIAEQYKKFAFIAYCLRFAPTYKVIKDYIQSGSLGKVFGVRACVAGKKAITDASTDYRSKKSMGGGVVSDFSHEIDYSLWFVDKPVVNVTAKLCNVVHKKWDVPDAAELLLECEDDVTISIHMDFLQPYFGRSIEVYGEQGAIRWRDNELLQVFQEERGCWESVESQIDWDIVYRDEMKYYLDCLNNKERPAVDEKHGLAIMKIIEACNG